MGQGLALELTWPAIVGTELSLQALMKPTAPADRAPADSTEKLSSAGLMVAIQDGT